MFCASIKLTLYLCFTTFAKDSIEHLQVDNSFMSYMLINSAKEMNANNQKPNAKIDALQ